MRSLFLALAVSVVLCGCSVGRSNLPTTPSAPCIGDNDGDGVVSLAEAVAITQLQQGGVVAPGTLESVDVNEDGTMSDQEFGQAIFNHANGICVFLFPGQNPQGT